MDVQYHSKTAEKSVNVKGFKLDGFFMPSKCELCGAELTKQEREYPGEIMVRVNGKVLQSIKVFYCIKCVEKITDCRIHKEV